MDFLEAWRLQLGGRSRLHKFGNTVTSSCHQCHQLATKGPPKAMQQTNKGDSTHQMLHPEAARLSRGLQTPSACHQ